MSLLLQALQKAARNREGNGADQDAPGNSPGDEFELEPAAPAEDFRRTDVATAQDDTAPLEELTLAEEDDLFGPDALTEVPPDSEPEADPPPPIAPGRYGPRPLAAPSSAHAASILRAGETRSTGALDWVRDRPVHTLAVLAGTFLVFYAIYVYLQIAHPGILRGDFLSQPVRSKSPPPPPSPISSTQPLATPALQTAAVETTAPVMTGMPAEVQEPPAGQAEPPPATTPAASASPRKPVREERARPAGSEAERPVRAARMPAPSQPAQSAAAETAMVEAASLEDNVAVRTPERVPQAMPSVMLAWDALQQGRFQEAESLYKAAAEIDRDNVDVLLGLAAIAVHRGHTDQAARYYASALEREPRNPTAQAGLISIIGQADPQMSETRLKQLIAQEPSGFLYFSLGNLYARQGLWAQAQRAYYQAYQLQPDHPDYAYNLAIGLEHLGQPKIALNYYRRALELTLQRGHASFDQGRVQERIGQLTARVGSD